VIAGTTRSLPMSDAPQRKKDSKLLGRLTKSTLII